MNYFLTAMESIDPNNPPPTVVAFGNIGAAFVANVKSWPGFEKYAEALDKWDFSKIAMAYIKVVEPMKNGFRVLNHGDMWINNFMFKYDEGKLSDVQFIDFQLSFWGSPANDLLYFFITSVRDGDKLQNFDNLMEFYHRKLVSSLKKLDYQKPIPTLAELHVDLLEKGSYGRSSALFTDNVILNHLLQPFSV
jgi:aminoglycoside phosphotransferase (APT) family kinase protein